MSRPRKYPEELLERGVRLALESGRPITHVAADLGVHPETLRKRVRREDVPELIAGSMLRSRLVSAAIRDLSAFDERDSPCLKIWQSTAGLVWFRSASPTGAAGSATSRAKPRPKRRIYEL